VRHHGVVYSSEADHWCEVMINEELAQHEIADLPDATSALVIGDGPSGLLAARALVDLGVPVSLMKSDPSAPALFCAAPGFDDREYLRDLSSVLDRVQTFERREPIEVLREGRGFLVHNGKEAPRYFGCIVFAQGTLRKSIPADLPQGVESMAPDYAGDRHESVAFLLDYGKLSNPAAGMAAIEQARQNRAAGGQSVVLMRHVPVRHLFGEHLYESAKAAGVRFFRFGDQLPLIELLPEHNATGPRFRITVKDLIEAGEPIVIECDRIIAATGADPSALPSHMMEVTGGDVDSEGFLLSSSIHCAPGKSFSGGIFAVGECTGSLDLLDVTSQAAAVAAEARAWIMGRAAAERQEDTIRITDECCRCLTCFRVCPHTAISYEGAAARSGIRVSSAACQECGVCVAECPRIALDLISFPEISISSFLAEVEKVADSEPLVIYGCHRSAARAVSQSQLPGGVFFFSVPCAGRVSEPIIWATLAAGAKGLLIVGCHHGNCASRDGTDWAEARVNSVLDALRASGRADVRLHYATSAANEEARLLRLIRDFHSSLHDVRF
jgi:quinone-modifying oxidoreductase subunit QmoB